MEVSSIRKTSCYHCGDDCVDEQIIFDEKYFCCFGCQAVYELIESSDLHPYYENTELRASKGQDLLEAQRKYGFLDLEKVIKQLLAYQDQEISLVRFYLSGIHCSSCIFLLEHLPKLNKSILRAEVNFIRKQVSITFDHNQLTLKELAVLLSRLGYPPTINLDSLDQTKKRTSDSGIGLKIAVAGFCFGNSMLISLPEYLDVGYQLDNQFKSLFGFINILLALPVIFYAASDYFISSWKGIRHRYLTIDFPIALGILTLFSRSAIEILYQLGPGYVDSLTGLVFFLLVGKWYQGKTYQALSFERDYTSYFPISVTRIYEPGHEEIVTVEDLEVGDQILIRNQELIPADSVIIAGEGHIDYSFVTGEVQPVTRYTGETIYAGGRQVGAELQVILTKKVNNSELTQLWNSPTFSKTRNHYDQLIDRIARYFTLIIVLLAMGTGIYWSVADPDKVWDSVTAVLIIACPCALALTLPFAFGHSMRFLGRRGVYLKNANVIEMLSKIRMIVFDKTGTITKTDPMNIHFCGPVLTPYEKSLIKTTVSNSAHPLSKLISKHLGENRKLTVASFEEQIGMGIISSIDSKIIQVGSAKFLKISDKSDLHESRVHIRIDGDCRGYFSIMADYRKDIFQQLMQLRKTHQLHLLSGDNPSEKSRLAPYFDHLLFNQRPAEKLSYVQNLDQPVLMVGDGLNDAGALKAADVGFAVCEDIHQFSPACDALLAADAIGGIPNVLRFSKGVMAIVIAAFILSFAYNAIGLSFAVAGQLTPVISAILMPVSSVTVVGFITLAVHLLGKRVLK